jgi:hypothetical protein
VVWWCPISFSFLKVRHHGTLVLIHRVNPSQQTVNRQEGDEAGSNAEQNFHGVAL